MSKENNSYQGRLVLLTAGSVLLLLAALLWSVLTGRYPLTLSGLLSGDSRSLLVFTRLRLPRALMGLVGGFGLGISGFVYQLIFKNPLAAPDIVGVSSGASAGAALAIITFSAVSPAVPLLAFFGGVFALSLTTLISYFVPGRNSYTIVLAGIAIHSVAQTLLMFLKLAADPEKQLASIEYWIMGSLNGVTSDQLWLPLFFTVLGFFLMLLWFRPILLLSMNEEEAELLGVNVTVLRFVVLLLATLIVSAILCVTGLISFIGLLAPHIAKLFTRRSNRSTFLLSGICGSLLLTLADIFARSLSAAELPVSIFTSLLGAPLLVLLLIKNGRKEHEG